MQDVLKSLARNFMEGSGAHRHIIQQSLEVQSFRLGIQLSGRALACDMQIPGSDSQNFKVNKQHSRHWRIKINLKIQIILSSRGMFVVLLIRKHAYLLLAHDIVQLPVPLSWGCHSEKKHRPGGLSRRHFSSHSSGGQKPKIKVPRCFPLRPRFPGHLLLLSSLSLSV